MFFIPPILLLIFAANFAVLYCIDFSRKHLLMFSLSFASFGVAFLVQILKISDEYGANSMTSGVLYLFGALACAEAVMSRSQKHLSSQTWVWGLGGVMLLLVYFFYIDANLLARVYILNFGLGAIFLSLCWEARFLLKGTKIDKLLYWMNFGLGFHFFPRTILTAWNISPQMLYNDSSYTQFWVFVMISMALLGVGMGLGILSVVTTDVVLQLQRERDIDPLTGVLNRRGLQRRLDQRGAKSLENSCIILCDLDDFKALNDKYGHVAGDEVLAVFGEVLHKILKSEDLICRTGGEEFLIVQFDTSERNAFYCAERLRLELSARQFSFLKDFESVTASFGIAELRGDIEFWQAVKAADKALYAAKHSGRNTTSLGQLRLI